MNERLFVVPSDSAVGGPVLLVSIVSVAVAHSAPPGDDPLGYRRLGPGVVASKLLSRRN